MKTREVLAVAALVSACAGGAALAADAHPSAIKTGPVHPFFSVTPRSVTLYDQNGGGVGDGILSQNVEPEWDAYDNQGADDFTVPVGHTWRIIDVDVTGVGTPTDSENVFFYKNHKGRPGKLVAKCERLIGKGDGYGAF